MFGRSDNLSPSLRLSSELAEVKQQSQQSSLNDYSYDEEKRESLRAALVNIENDYNESAAAAMDRESRKLDDDNYISPEDFEKLMQGKSELMYVEPRDSEEKSVGILAKLDSLLGNKETYVKVPGQDPEEDEFLATADYYRDNDLINLRASKESNNDVINAAIHFQRQPEKRQKQLIRYFKFLIRQSRRMNDGTPISDLFEYAAPVNNKMVTVWEALPEAEQIELLDCYIDCHLRVYNTIVAHCVLGIIGELFYLKWDEAARESVLNKFFPSTPDLANHVINYTATLPIAMANFTFWPSTLARDYMKNRMISQASFMADIRSNRLQSLAFLLYAFGGGYIEIVDINDKLDILTLPGKLAFEGVLLYAAVAYYTAFQFSDVVDMAKKYSALPSLLKKTWDINNGEDFDERAVAFWNGMHEFVCFVERIFRMSYGGYMAGLQQSGQALAYSFAAAVGLGTAPVAYALRTYPLRNLYNLNDNANISYHQRKAAVSKFNNDYNANKLKGELKLFFTPYLSLITPGAIWTTSYAISTVENPVAKAAIGTATAVGTLAALHFGLFLRHPARRRAIVNLAMKENKPEPGTLVPNRLAYGVAGTVNLFDQMSRAFTFCYSMNAMMPELFDMDTRNGTNMMLSVLFLEFFISISAWLYQMEKNAATYAGMRPSLFGAKVQYTDEDAALNSLLGERSTNPFESDSEIEVVRISEMDDATSLLPSQMERSDRASYCNIM